METLHKNKEKIEKISQVMHKLLTTESNKKTLIEDNRDLIDSVTPIDLFYVEMYNEKSNQSIETIKASANKFVNLFYKPLKAYQINTHDHPFFQALLDENTAIIDHFDHLKTYFKKGNYLDSKDALLEGFEKALNIEKKFIKKENILFPYLEKHVPSTKPLEVMWSLHDDARAQLKSIIKQLKETNPNEKALKELIGTYYYLIYGIIQKERLILLPVAVKYLNTETLDSMAEEAKSYWYTFIESPKITAKNKKDPTLEKGVYHSETGTLTFKQLTLLLNHLPVEITYVDKDDKVSYFNDTKTRHFPRNPSIIGRKVEHCHPPKSVDTVKRIVQAFKDKTKDFAAFWITYKEHFLYITYYAIRDENGDYQGVLEVSQDVTEIRSLEGESRLLDWE